MGQRFDASLFHESVSDIDHLLGEDLETFREHFANNFGAERPTRQYAGWVIS